MESCKQKMDDDLDQTDESSQRKLQILEKDELDENEATEVEVNFRLDPNGRTLPASHESELPSLDYTTRVILTHFESIQLDNNNSKCSDDPDNINHPRLKPEHTDDDEERHNTVLDDILLDCDIADSC